MTPWLVAGALVLIAAVSTAIQFWAHLRSLNAHEQSSDPVVDVDRYRPMLRLLSCDASEHETDPALSRKMRKERSEQLRGYLRDLTGDYAKLLGALRLVMVQSADDRPDLAKTLARNRLMFAVAMCRIDLSLRLYDLGMGRNDLLRRDVLGLVDTLNVLRGQFQYVESAVWGA